jgi:serine/threonine protein kinase/Flp pilus assembly protein TadD
MIGQTISHYRVLSKLGEGGMGVVYLAEDILLGRRVAIKALTAEPGKQNLRARLLREAQAVSTLKHPNIATIHEYGETPEGQPFIVMEFIGGQSLGDLIDNCDLELGQAMEIVEQVAAALTEAHGQKIIHRDIKPSNVIVNERNEVKVLDFGLAKILDDGAEAEGDGKTRALMTTQTREGVIVGTPMYLSPEQALGLSVDRRSDIFSLGAVLYECITGQPAFPGTSAAAVCAKVIRDEPLPPSQLNPNVPPELDDITRKALAKEVEQRYQSAEELADDLRALRASMSGLRPLDVPKPKRTDVPSPRTSVLLRLAGTISRPRAMLLVFLSTFVFAVLAIWAVSAWHRASPYQPSPAAQHWYDKGVEALRNGDYYTASKRLREAVKIDDNFALAHARLADAQSELDYADEAKDEIIHANRLVQDRSKLPELDALYLQAIADTIARDFPKAVEGYQRIEQLVPATEKAAALLDVGRAFDKSEAIEKAIESYREATKLDPQYAAAFLRLGIAYARKLDLQNAELSFAEAQRLYQALSDLEGVTAVHYQRGYLLNELRRVSEARAQLEQGLAKARATGNQYQQILILLKLSSVSFNGGNTTLAQTQAREAIDLARSGGMENLTTRGLIDLGNAFFGSGKYTEAESYFSQALEFARKYKGRRNEARALLSLGSLYTHLGKTEEARRYVEQSLPFYRQGGYRNETSQALTILGHIYDQTGQYDAAAESFNEQLRMAKQSGNRLQEALAHQGLGLVYQHQENFTAAKEHSEKSLEQFKALGVQQNIGHSLIQRGSVLWQLGYIKDAREALTSGLALKAQVSGEFGEFNALLSMLAAGIELSEQRFDLAKADSRRAIAAARDEYKEIAIQSRYTLALTQSRSGAPLSGETLCREAVEMAERLGDPQLLAQALIAQAETQLRAGETQKGLAAALRVEEICSRLKQYETAWRAALLAAWASRQQGDEAAARRYAAQADSFFEEFGQRLSADDFSAYTSRPDVQSFRRQYQSRL